MTPLMAIFVSEARELLDSVGKGLLVLETNPDNESVINAIFRALHTLKGSSGLFDPELAPLTKLFHAGEDLLDEVRKGRIAFTSAMADQLLSLVDRMSETLDTIEEDHFQPDQAIIPCAELAGRLREFLGQKVEAVAVAPPGPADEETPPWLSDEVIQQAIAVARERGGIATAIHYVPDRDCFFFGGDPLLLLRQIPELVSLGLETCQPTSEEAADPFQCLLSATAVSLAPREQLEALLASEGTQVTLWSVPLVHKEPAAYPMMEILFRVLAEQQTILELPCNREEWRARLHATGQVVKNCLLRWGRNDWLSPLDAALHESEKVRGCAPLLGMVRSLVNTIVPPKAPARPGSSEESAVKEEASRGKVIKVDQHRIDRLINLTGELVVAKNTMPFIAERAILHHNNPSLSQEIMEFYGLIHRLSNELQSAVMQVRMLPVMHVFQRFPRLVRDISRKLGKQVNLVMTGGDTEADKNVIESLSDPLIHLIRNSLDHGLESPGQRRQAGKEEQGEIHLLARQENDRVVIEISDNGRGIDPAQIRDKALEKGVITAKRRDELSDMEAIQLIFAPGFSTVNEVSDLSGRGVGMDAVKTVVESFGGRVQLTSQLGKGTRVRLEMPLSMAVTRVMLFRGAGSLYGIPLNQVVETVRIPRTAIHPIKGVETTTLRGKLLPLERISRLLGESTVTKREEEAILVVRPWEEEIGLVVDDFNKGMDVILKPLEGVVANSRGCAGGALLGDGSVLLVLNLQELLSCP